MRSVAVLLAGLLGLSLVPFGATPASAAPSDGFATWSLQGGSTAYTGTVDLPTGFPDVSFVSNSLASATMIPTGASTWIPASTTFGAAFGSSRDKPYISLRPAANRVGAPSTTTYTFASPTPTSGWGFSLGDIDSEILTVTAIAVDGSAVPAQGLGLVDTFNYCGLAGSPACAAVPPAYNPPAAASTPGSVVLQDLECPQVQVECDTAGAAAWFAPTVPLRSLTVTAAWKSGLPTYQTWFTTITRAVAGAIDYDCAPAASVNAQLLDAAGTAVATTPVDAAGAFGFPRVAARADYAVRVDPQSLGAGSTATEADVDASLGDATAVPLTVTNSFPVSGTVAGSVPLDGLAVTLTSSDPSVPPSTVATDAGGAYLFPAVSNGDYLLSVTPRAGFTVMPAKLGITTDCAAASVAAFAVAETPTGPTDPPDPTDPTDPTDPLDPGEPETPLPGEFGSPTGPAGAAGSAGGGLSGSGSSRVGASGGNSLPSTGSEPTLARLLGGSAMILLTGGLALVWGRGSRRTTRTQGNS